MAECHGRAPAPRTGIHLHAKVVVGRFTTRASISMYLNLQYRPAHRPAARSPRRRSLLGGCWKGVSNKRCADEKLGSQGQGNDGELKHTGFGHTADPRRSFPGQTRASGSRKRAGGVTSVVASPRLSGCLNGPRVTPQSRSHSSQEESNPGGVC